MRKIEKEIYDILLKDGSLEKYMFSNYVYFSPGPKFQRKLLRILEDECKLNRNNFAVIIPENGEIKSYIYTSVPKKRINIYINNVRNKLARMCASYIMASKQIKYIVPDRKPKDPFEKVCINDLYHKRIEKDKEAKELEEWKKSSSIKYVNEKDLNLETKSDKNKKKWKTLKNNKEWKVGGTI